ncbi:MAG: patatin-like phospholipase RssA [Gammaproteobacteria bacterium]|nr:patatin-like phospholipase RssA [Gammaproteobacteria bacterium]
MNRACIGLALGGGAARGWSHIAVLRELELKGIRPGVVAGTSIGALVGAAYALGRLGALEVWVRAMRWPNLAGYFDIRLEGGLIAGERLMAALAELIGDANFADCHIPFAAVATDLETGQERWLREGRVLDAVRASIAMPILFSPVRHEDTWLVDGGLVNPVPVSLCRAMGAGQVIAVDLLSDALERETLKPASSIPEKGLFGRVRRAMTAWLGRGDGVGMPSILDVMGRSVNIMQLRIGRSRLAGDPPDILLMPRMPEIGLLDFHRAEEAMQAGRQAVDRASSALHLLIRDSQPTTE